MKQANKLKFFGTEGNPQLATVANELFVVWQEDISGNNQIYFTTVGTS